MYTTYCRSSLFVMYIGQLKRTKLSIEAAVAVEPRYLYMTELVADEAFVLARLVHSCVGFW